MSPFLFYLHPIMFTEHIYFELECFSPMGMSNGTIMDHEISGSSTIDQAHPAFYARVITARKELVSTRGSWCAKLADKEQFLEVDLKKPRKVTGERNTIYVSRMILLKVFRYSFLEVIRCTDDVTKLPAAILEDGRNQNCDSVKQQKSGV